MSGDFGLDVAPGSGNQNSLIAVQNLALTVPPASSGSFTIAVNAGTNVSIGTLPTPPNGLSWSANTLTVSSSFSGTATVTIPFTATGYTTDSSPTTTFTISQSGTSAAGSQTTLTLNTDGSFGVNPGAGVNYNGVFTYLTAIPTSGEIQLTSPVFFVPTLSSSSSVTFSVTGNSGVTVTNVTVPSSQSALQVSGTSPSYTVTVSSPSALTTSGVPVTVSYGGSAPTGFTVVSSGAAAADGQSSLQVNSDGSFLLTQLASGVKTAGCNNTYEATGAQTFKCTAYGLTYPNGANSITFTGAPSTITPTISGNTISFTDPSNTTDTAQQFTFSAATSAGTLDPTIINQPDAS